MDNPSVKRLRPSGPRRLPQSRWASITNGDPWRHL